MGRIFGGQPWAIDVGVGGFLELIVVLRYEGKTLDGTGRGPSTFKRPGRATPTTFTKVGGLLIGFFFV